MKKTKVLSNNYYDLSIDISERKKKYICKKRKRKKRQRKLKSKQINK